MKRIFMFFLFALVSGFLHAGYPLEIIEMKARSVEEMIPIIRPLVEPDGTVTGMQNQLIIRTSPERLTYNKLLLP